MRRLTMVELVRAAHHFAEQHVKRNVTPNELAFMEEWNAFRDRNKHKLGSHDFEFIRTYAEAACRYDMAPTAKPAGLWDRDLMAKLDAGGGLVAPIRGIAATPIDEEDAA